ncbi:MAG: thiol:disulfide interchange protein, partial [Alistipes sp.]|nr:thiol:disulfide interchange protein [Alistipes sp.]
MKKLMLRMWLLAVALFAMESLTAQDVRWTVKTDSVAGERYRLLFEAEIPMGYHMYDLGPYVGGPMPTTIAITADGAEVEGALEALDKPHREYDAIFDMEIGYYERMARFAQWVRLVDTGAVVKAQLDWQICRQGACVPGDIELSITLGEPKPAAEHVQEAPETIAEAPKDVAGGGSLWSLIIEAIL